MIVKTQKLYSFDIFDTLVTRKTATPSGIFYIIQEMIKCDDFPEYLKANFKTIRCETEKFLRENLFKTQGFEEVSFEEIYKRIQNDYSLTDLQRDKLMELEISCEAKNLIPIEENLNRLKQLVSSGENVILISDMYHSKETLKQILSHIDSVFNDIEIFVSAESRKTKQNGSMYKFVKEKYSPEEWEHFGDNKYADIKKALKHNINAKIFNYVKLKKYELQALQQDNLTTELFLGCSKNLRLKSNNKKYDFGASFAGPILYIYAKWLIENALNSGIENLYFIARDGFIPKLIADIIINEKNLNIKTHYIYGSRKAWRVTSEEQKELLIKYLKTQIDFSGKFAFVDINGSGKTQDMLAEIISQSIRTFYFCTSSIIQDYENSKKSIFITSLKYSNVWLELLCRHIDGQTIGYQEKNGKIEPVLEQIDPQKLINWGYYDYIQGITDFAKEAVKLEVPILTNFYYNFFDFVMNSIDKETADILGSIPFTETGTEVNSKECAPAYNLLSAFGLLFSKRNQLLFISKGRSKGLARKIIELKIEYKSFRKFLINVYVNKKSREFQICLLGIKINLGGII